MKLIAGFFWVGIVFCTGMALFGTISTLLCFEPEPSEKTIEIHEAFLIAEKYIISNSIPPSQEKMNNWFNNYSGSNKLVSRLMYERSTDKKHLPRLLGEIPNNSYLLAFWRNEWMEEYAPWSKKTTMCSIEKDCNSLSRNGFWIMLYTFIGLAFHFVVKQPKHDKN